MKIAYVTRIKNEERLIYFNLKYYYNIGIRNFYIIHNLSNDETRNLVNKFEQNHPDCIVNRIEDKNTKHMQNEFFNNVSDMAFNDGCKWIIPIDADEILKIPSGMTIQDCLKPHDKHEYGYIKCQWIDYQPTNFDDDNDINFFTKWKYREGQARPQSKIIVKWTNGMKWGDGHHLVIAKGNKIIDAKKMFYAHFPNRELEQIIWKRLNIGRAFIEKYGYDSEKPQIQEYKRWEKEGDQYFVNVWNKLLKKRKDNINNYLYDPIDPLMFE